MLERLTVVLFVLTAAVQTQAQGSADPNARTIIRLDPALDQIVSPDAKLEILKGDYFGVAEGPVWIDEGISGYLLFSDIGANVVYKWTPEGKLDVFLEKSGFNGDAAEGARQGFGVFNGRMNILNFGSNGMTLDRQGRLIICQQGNRTVIRIEPDGTRTVIADRYEGKRLNRPNDVVVKSDGAIYFSDPRPANNPLMELPWSGVYRVKDGQITLLTNELQQPQGVAFSPDERYMYANDLGKKLLWRYDVQPDGTVKNARLFADLSGDPRPGSVDGLKIDVKGNVYCTGPGGIWIFSPEGKHLGTIRLPDTAMNMAFGDADSKTLYVTNRKTLARIRINTPGIRPKR